MNLSVARVKTTCNVSCLLTQRALPSSSGGERAEQARTVRWGKSTGKLREQSNADRIARGEGAAQRTIELATRG